MSQPNLKPEHLKARLIRALSGLTQEQMSEKTGIPKSLIDHFEQGEVLPGEGQLERMGRCADIEPADADELLRLHQLQTRTWLRTSEGAGTLLAALIRRLRRHSVHAVQGLLKLPPPEPADRGDAEEQLANLKRLSHRSRLAVVSAVREYQSPALAERCRQESERYAGVDARRAASWAEVAAEIEDLAG